MDSFLNFFHTIDFSLIDGALKAGLTMFVGLLMVVVKTVGTSLVAAIKSWAKAHLHARAAGVVDDSVDAAISRVLPKVVAAAADLHFTDAELADIKGEALKIAEERLTELSGFSRTDMRKWILDQIEVSLGKLFSRISGKNALLQSLNPFGPGPNDPAR